MIKEYERELNELQEGKLISKEDLHEGDEIIYNGEHYFVTRTDTGTDYVWITDDKSERYNRDAQGWTLKADWIDEVIGQPEEDELDESLKKRYKKFPLKENKNKKLKEDWDDEDEEIGYCVLVNGGSPLTFSNKKDAIKKAKELIQDKFNAGKSIHIYKGNLNSESYPGWDDYDEFDGEWKEILKLEAPENFNLNSFDQYVKEKSAYGYEGEDIDPEDLTYEYLDDMSASGLLNIPDKYAKDPDNVDDDEAFAYFDDLIKKYNLVDRVKKMLKESTSKEKL